MNKNYIPKLIKASAKKSDKARCEALEKIRCITDPKAFDQLVELLQHNDFAVKCAAIEALCNMGDDRAFDPILLCVQGCDNKKPLLESMKKLTGIHHVDAIILLLNSPDIGINTWATDEIVRIGDESVPHLIKALPDSPARGRAQMISILNDIGSKDVTDQIADYIKDDDSNVRYQTCSFLHKFGEAKYTKQIVSAMKLDLSPKSHWQVKDRALSMLKKIRSKEAIKLMINVWQNEYEDTYTRKTAWLKLTEILPRKELDSLTSFNCLTEGFLETMCESGN